MNFVPRKYSPEMTKAKIEFWCNKAERAHQDVRKKLQLWGVPYTERESLISELVQMNLLNESRYAEAFTIDHFRFRGWGAIKIKMHLMKKGVSERNIADALKRIAPSEARAQLLEMAERKWTRVTGKTDYHRKQKLAASLLRKGFSSDDVWWCVNKISAAEEDVS